MATAGSSPTPQWDSRNNGFIPPAQLNRLRQASPLAREFVSSERPRSMATDAPPSQGSYALRPSLPTSSNHARSSSFFAFLKPNDNVPSTMPARTAEPGQQRQVPADEQGRLSADTRQPHPPPSSTLDRVQSLPTLGQSQPPPPQLHPEIRSVVNLTHAHAHKVYMSGPLVRRIERLPDGHHPAKDEGWREVWAQLGGTTLSVWDMKEIEEARAQGKEVPPTYINVTDAFVQVLGAVTIPASLGKPVQKYNNVVTLNTAGSNLILFSCPNAAALISWATALRLSAWEKARLEEVYTAHLIRITLGDGHDTPSTLVRGRREGWVRIRIAGQTDWKHLWMAIIAGPPPPDTPGSPPKPTSPPPEPQHKRRISSLFGRDNNQSQAPPTAPLLVFYPSPKPKDRKKPFLTLRNVSQAFAVYPERPELINKSTLMKIEGTIGDQEVAMSMRKREGWVLVMPELEAGVPQANETIRWLIAFHDAFSLYGRPRAYSWDPRDQASMMFAYPVGPARDSLFLERESAETMDPRDDQTSTVRSRLLNILSLRLQVNSPQSAASKSQSSTLSSTIPSLLSTEGQAKAAPQNGYPLHMPPLNIGSPGPEAAMRRALTPIVEGSVISENPNRLPIVGAAIPSNDAALKQEQSETPSPAPVSLPSVYTPTEGSSVPVSPPVERSEESSTAKPSTANGISLTDGGRSERPSVDGTRPKDAGAVSPTSPASLQSSTASPPSLSPTISNLPSSVSPVKVPRRSPSPKFSVLTSPHSMTDSPARPNPNQSFSEFATESRPPLPAPLVPRAAPIQPSLPSRDSVQTTDSSRDGVHGIYDEAGALYYIQQVEQGALDEDQPTPEGDDKELSLIREISHPSHPQFIPPAISPLRPKTASPPPPPTASSSRLLPSIDTSHRKPPIQPLPRTPTLDYGPDRRPAGARAAPVSNRQDAQSSTAQLSRNLSMRSAVNAQQGNTSQSEDPDADALAALTFLERHQDDGPVAPAPMASPPQAVASRPSQETPAIVEPDAQPQTPESENTSAYRSSFAPSKNAMQRKARSDAHQAAHEAATHRPGHGEGKTKGKSKSVGAWGDSSDEEEEEEEEEDVDSDGEPVAPRDDRSVSNYAASINQRSRISSPRGSSPLASGGDVQPAQPHPRPPRNLPPVPIPRGQAHDVDALGPRRPDQFDAGRRSYYEDGVSHGYAAPQGPIPTHAPAPVPPRHMWSQVLDPGHTPGAVPENSNTRDTFIQLESPAQTMTKAFTPHGLLSAGLQDKEDRSAKRQEELARETGASLINVPSKPLPPQTGLLGAITAHERDRKREGGVGAALTEREREKRLAEERQRKLDELQRQQLEQMQQGGSLYGQQLSGYNPMMNPMMMGMNPMMTPFMGYPGIMPGFGNPQHMFAAQQAAQAYQQAMLSLSQAGSQIGGEGGIPAPMSGVMTSGGIGGPSPAPLNPMMTTPTPLSPMMTGGGMGMGAFDPRFSMMMMNPMAMGMGLGSPGMMGTPMGMGMPMNTGAGFVDPRMSQFDPGLQAPSPNYLQSSRPTSSNLGPNPNASPAPSDGARRSASASPRPPH
ncbi:hypothetical protein F5148DRAFT_1165993 [Russula earlei]|uniref:Uncharacterized protein n=1 Tax=Russula earlei TaxID=71964 RepID=A0ACC0ULH4_9AGAM|nr:hypothetical protein F5148DRAFT_1165993 [Russula earlei]